MKAEQRSGFSFTALLTSYLAAFSAEGMLLFGFNVDSPYIFNRLTVGLTFAWPGNIANLIRLRAIANQEEDALIIVNARCDIDEPFLRSSALGYKAQICPIRISSLVFIETSYSFLQCSG